MLFGELSFPVGDWKDYTNKPIAFYMPDNIWYRKELFESLKESEIKCLYRLEQMFKGERVETNIFYIKDGATKNEIQILTHKSDIYKLLDKYYSIVPIELMNENNGRFIYTVVMENDYI